MISGAQIRLAKVSEARCIAVMSRDWIESGLGWSWTAPRVVGRIRGAHANVIVCVEGNRIAGFAIMSYSGNEAHLELLGVRPDRRLTGVGKCLVNWLETTALVFGAGVVYLETRSANRAARRFYERLGYRVVQRIPAYYKGRETALRMARDLWAKRFTAR